MLVRLQEEKFRNSTIYLLPIGIILFFPTKFLYGVSLFEIYLLIALVISFKFSLSRPAVISSFHLILLSAFILSILNNMINAIEWSEYSYLFRFLEALIIFFLAYYVYSEKNEATLVKSAKHITILLLVVGLVQIVFPELILKLNWGPEWRDKYVEYRRVRVYSTLDNPLNLVAICALLFPLIARQGNKLYLLALIVLMVLSGSKTSLLILGIGLLMISRKMKVKSILYSIAGLIILTGVLLLIKDHLFIIERFIDPEMFQRSMMQRVYMYSSSLNMIWDNLFFGIGYGEYSTEYISNYKHPLASLAESSFTAENYVLDLLLDNGLLPSLLIFLLIYLGIKRNISGVGIGRYIAEALILFIAIGMFTNLRAAPVNFMLFYFIGISFKIGNLYEKQEVT